MSFIHFTQVRVVVALLFGSLLAAGCSGSGSGSNPDTVINGAQSPASGGDIEQQPPVTQQPANDSITGGSVVTTASSQMPDVDASGQVTWPYAPQASGVELEVMAFVEMPLASSGRPARWNDMEYTGERLFVSDEQDGRIYEITNRQATLWFDVASAIQASTGRNLNTTNPFHGGVRGFAFHPNFTSNGKFYVSMMQDRPVNPSDFAYVSDANAIAADSVLVEWTANPGTFAVDTNSYREVFRVGIPEYDHPIKQIAFNPYAQPGQEDFGLLYVAHGDGTAESSSTSDGEGNNALGKILRINPLQSGSNRYSIPSGNPFIGNADMPDEVYSLGHRNPHHLAFMPDGSLLTTESGRDNIDEINLVEKGANYGWSQREGAYVSMPSGTLANGISALPSDDAANGFTYPVIQFGHSGPIGATFVGQALGGGFLLSNGSELDGEFFYVEFVSSGRLFHSSYNSILASQTTGNPAGLTMAQTFEASVVFDHDGNSESNALTISMPELLQSTGSYDGSGRVDVRIGQGPLGEMYLMNKRNNMIYLVRNSYPPGRAIPAAPGLSGTPDPTVDVPTSTRVDFDITVPAYVSNALQIRLVWGDKDLTASWVVDETWAVSDDFPTDTQERLIVTFSDRNGEITLGSYETDFRTGSNHTESVQINAAQFDTGRWDNDSDGVSNIDELIAGADPLVSDLREPPTFTEIQQEVFSRGCDGCHDNSPAGGLSLTPGNSYANLVGQFSSRKEDAILVIPFDPDNSYLVQKMEGAEGIVGSRMTYGGPTFAQRVREWIAAGALNN